MSTVSIAILLKKDPAREFKLQAALEALGLKEKWEVIEFEDRGELRKVLQTLKHKGIERVLIGGGDGTLHIAVEEILKIDSEKRIPLGVAPLGTANDFAHATNFPEKGLPRALQAAAAAPIDWVDVGWVNEIPFLNVVTGGDLTKATTDISPAMKSTFGKMAYFLNALAKLPNIQAHQLHFQCAGWETKLSCMGFSVANSSFVGGGLKIAPDAKLNDGYLDLLVVPEQSTMEISLLAKELMKVNPQLDNQKIIQRRVSSLRIDSDDEIQINADGEPLISRQFNFRVMPRFLQMAVAKPEALVETPCSLTH